METSCELISFPQGLSDRCSCVYAPFLKSHSPRFDFLLQGLAECRGDALPIIEVNSSASCFGAFLFASFKNQYIGSEQRTHSRMIMFLIPKPVRSAIHHWSEKLLPHLDHTLRADVP